MQEAIAEFKNSLKITPGHHSTEYYLATCYGVLQQHEESIKWADIALKSDSKDDATWFNKALALKKLKRNEEALVSIDKSLELVPKNDDAWILKGNILQELGDNENSIVCYDNALNINPHNSLARQNKITSLKNLGRLDDIKKTEEEGRILDEDDPQSIFLKGLAHFKAKKYQKALEFFNKGLEMEPNDPSAKQYRNITLEKLKEIDQLVNWKPNSINELYKKSEKLFSLNKFDEVVQCSDEILKLDQNQANAYFNKGVSLFKLGNQAEAMNNINKAEELDPDNPERLASIGAINALRQKYKVALQYYERALALKPNFEKALKEKELVLKKLGIKEFIFCTECGHNNKYTSNFCIKCGSKLEKIEPEDSKQTLDTQAKKQVRVVKKIEGVEKALETYNQLEKIINEIKDIDKKDTIRKLFDQKFKSSDKYQQVEFLEELVKLIPDNKYVLNLLEKHHMEISNLGRAALCVKKIVKLDPSDISAWNRLGWMYTIQGKFEEAINCLNKSNEIKPNNPEFLKNYSLVNEVIGEKEIAINYLQRYLAINPDDHQANDQLEDLLHNRSENLGIGKTVKETLGLGYFIDMINMEYIENGQRISKILPLRDEDDYADIDISGKMLIEFKNVKLLKEETDFLQEIENQTGEVFVSSETSYIGQKMSFSVFKNRVIELNIDKVNLSSIPESISQLEAIRTIHISKTNIKTLPDSIGDLKRLENLHLSFNQNLSLIPNSIGKLKNLVKLYTTSNQLEELPQTIGNLDSLTIFHSTHNKLKKLPESIGDLKSIEHIDFQGNQLDKLPESIGNLTTLESLCLFNNKLMELPESIGGLSSLKELWVGMNRLTEIPESIGNLKNLEWIKLNENPIQTLSWSIYNLPSLRKVDFFKDPLYSQLNEESKKMVDQLHYRGVVLDNP